MALQKVEDHLLQALGFNSQSLSRRGIEEFAVPGGLKVTSYPKRSALFSIGLETKKKEKNDFKHLHNKRNARKY